MQPIAGYGPPHAGYGATAGGTYEFTDGENLTITDVARWARLWGIISLVSGALTLVAGIVVIAMGGVIAAATARSGAQGLSTSALIAALGVALVPAAIVSIVGGVFYLRAGTALRSVVDTQGNDIELLTNAVSSLTLAFKIEAITMAAGFVIGLVFGVIGHASGGQ